MMRLKFQKCLVSNLKSIFSFLFQNPTKCVFSICKYSVSGQLREFLLPHVSKYFFAMRANILFQQSRHASLIQKHQFSTLWNLIFGGHNWILYLEVTVDPEFRLGSRFNEWSQFSPSSQSSNGRQQFQVTVDGPREPRTKSRFFPGMFGPLGLLPQV